jgi:hypothetical protein
LQKGAGDRDVERCGLSSDGLPDYRGCPGDGGRPFPVLTRGGHGGHGVERFGIPIAAKPGVINVAGRGGYVGAYC